MSQPTIIREHTNITTLVYGKLHQMFPQTTDIKTIFEFAEKTGMPASVVITIMEGTPIHMVPFDKIVELLDAMDLEVVIQAKGTDE